MTEIKVTMLGTGSPRPEIHRCGPAQLLTVDDTSILIDCGEGTTQQLMKAGVNPEDIQYLFFTHLHTDHTMGYQQFLFGGWELGRRKLTVIGPKGIKKYHETLLSISEEDIDYRLSLGRPKNGLLDVTIIEIDEPGEVMCNLPMNIAASEMEHSILTYAYRFDIENRSVVFSGDTAPNNSIIKISENADLLIQDCCLAPNKRYTNQKITGEKKALWDRINQTHCSPKQAGEIAAKANVKTIVLTHFLPEMDVKRTYEETKAEFSGHVIVPNDLREIVVKTTKAADSLA
ncbi:Ribonuclease BN, tRNA processing enzyme [Alteribacillus persepolensis]|uniref:Ribonuclease BN, tRNA processing enzyme n=1 Tax=Alteribacillus persepolensis TaxID=568899 RepID=A0A1G7Y6D0_9BACI|nr:MBL fold metallo-hydrolase [Alteribacillus persepolensis]SDG91883.1 Ribonuclease BN, tRNA processing enzyme [Alteribacillus persepolensis]